VRMYMAKMSEMCRALYEKATATRLPVRLCDVSQVNCDPDFGKVLLHTVLTSNGLHTDVPRTDGSHWIYDRHYGPYAL